MSLGERLQLFLNDPIVSIIWVLLVLSFLNFLYAVYIAFKTDTFDANKLPRILRTLVLERVFPLIIFGIAVKTVTGDPGSEITLASYFSLGAIAIAGEAKQLYDNVTGKTEGFLTQEIDGPIYRGS